MFKLVIADDEGKNTVVPLVRDEITIGRKEGNTIRLTERNVSRRHARLMKANGRFVIEDLHSYNGVRVNGTRIGAETQLEPGDQIQIGDYQLALQVDGADASTTPDAQAPLVSDAETAMIAAPGPPARLVMITPPAPGAEFVLTPPKVRLGRAEDLDIWVNHRSISREHAEIQKEPDGGLRLIDLGSANGVRVNGNDVQNALLQPGDVVELGQVRFRFVGAGEHYAFDADRTVQMDAVSLDRREGPSRAPLFAAIAIVGLAIVGAIAVALFWGGEDPEPTSRPLGDQPRDNPNPVAAADYDASLEACRTAVAALSLPDAIAAADTALAARPGDPDATACRNQAIAYQAEGQLFAEGVAQLRAGDHRQAHFKFAELPEASPYRQRPEIAQAAQGWAVLQLETGQQMLPTSPAEALAIARDVQLIEGITPSQRNFAESLERAAESAGASQPQIAQNVRPPPQQRPDRPERPVRQPRDPQQQQTQQQDPPQRPQQQDEPEGPSPAQAEAEARRCSMVGDNACVIRNLEGRARTEASMAMLIEAYRARGQTAAGLRQMRVYVERFPGTPRARNYQQILSAH
jgi:pSer/pThr/pTyr-binding forkhead associated (FHA) protein